MQVRPLTPDLLVAELADRIVGCQPDQRLRVAVDGADAADPTALANALVDPIRVRGRAALAIQAAHFLRPASLRLEPGRTNPDAFYDVWLDEPGLRREVLDRLGPHGNGQILPSLWDVTTDRATRADYLQLPPGAVVLISGPLLLGSTLPFDLTIHLSLTPAALARRTAPQDHWQLPAFDRYESEVAPARLADVVIRVDDPGRPAVVDAW